MPRSFDSVFYGAAGTDTDTGPSDDQFNRVSFLSHFDGANNGVNNAFDDGSTDNLTVTAAGNVTQGSFGPHGTNWSVDFDGGDYFTVPQDAGFNVDDGSYTMECFVNTTFSGYQNIIACWDGATGGNPGWGMFISSANKFGMFIGTAEVGKAGAALNDGAWHHLAGVFTNSGATVTLYVDGAQISTGSVTAPSDNAASIIRIGSAGNASASSLYTGKISNLRLVKGTAVYSGSGFTVPTSALTAITNTKLLVLGRNNFSDGSASGHVLTPISDPTVTAFGPILTRSVYDPAVNGASAEFGTVSDFLALPANSLNLGTNNFTIETWVYTPSTAQQLIVGSCVGSNGYGSYMFNLNYNSRKVRFFCRYAGGNVLDYTVESGSFSINSWNHVAVTRDSANLRIFINGTQAGSTNTTLSSSAIDAPRGGQNTQGTTAVYYVGKTTDASLPIIGSLCDLRVVVGTAVYTSNFTSPTAPLTAVTNTKLLLNMADGQAIDSAAQNTLTLVNDAKISTTRAKFGDTSLYLDGSDYAIIDDSSSRAFGTGDFTVELFIWLNGSPDQFDYIFDMRNSSGSTYTWALSFNYMGNTSNKLQWATNNTSATLVLSANYPSLNQWVHIAVCRSGTTTRMFYDGTQVAIKTSDTFDYRDTGYPGYVGARHSIQYYINAYMDEIRFSKMARYTSNFTAPSAPFADKGR